MVRFHLLGFTARTVCAPYRFGGPPLLEGGKGSLGFASLAVIFGAPVVEEVHVVGAVLSCTGLARAWWQAATAKGEFEMTSVLPWFLFAFRSPDDMLVEHLLHEARPLLREDGEWQIAGAETCGKIGRIPSVTRFVNVDQVKRQTPGRVQVDTGSGFCV